MLPVHEGNVSRGGAPLADLISECPPDAHSRLFPEGAEPPIPWERSRPMQMVSLTLIAEAILHELHERGAGFGDTISTSPFGAR